ncbi:MAG TPA: amidohydrolase family protein [Terriglobia bacterium]|nr:amidohydrolase family protein [Terriglobia bacterium]
MSTNNWNEEGQVWLEDHGLLDDDQVARCARADQGESFRSPVPTRMVSNGEYMPAPQTENQKKVEARIQALSETASKKLGIDRRRFLAGTGGMAAAFLAMNEVFGRFFSVTPIEMFEPEAYAQSGAPRDLFVFDDQLHMVRGSAPNPGGMLRAVAQGSTSGAGTNPMNPRGLRDERGDVWGVWNPALVGLPNVAANAQIVQFIKDVYLDSQITIGLLSNVTASVVNMGPDQNRPPRNYKEAMTGELLTAAQTAAARNFVNEISGSTRMLAHGLLYVGKGNLAYIQEQIEQNKPDSWKGYNISNAAKVDNDPNSLMRQWRHDDEAVAYPTFELIEKNYQKLKAAKPGFNNICVHKGLAPGPPDPERGHPRDLPKAAKDWPNLNFITYHACIQPAFFMYDALQEVKSGKMRQGVPDISWTTEYATLVAPYKNTYAEIGTTWASSIVTFPTVAAHIMGQLMKFMGPDRIVFGSDAVWYGSPQWQIDAMWRFQIPEDLRKKYGYPEMTPDARRKILGLNSAKLYGINTTQNFKPVPKDYEKRMSKELKTIMELPGFTADNMSKFRERYVEIGVERDNVRYGWIRTAL